MATKKKGTEPPKEPEVTEEAEASSEAPSNSPKIGRGTLALILKHIERREEKNDEIVVKQSKQGWWIAVLLVLGLLASIGVAGAVKLYGTDISFTPPAQKAP